jgi:NTE family protein
LSGGAARGIAHVGVLRVLEEHRIPVDCVAGTSAGALVAGALAAGMSVSEIEKMGRGLRWRDMGKVTLSRLGIQTNVRMEEFVRARFPVTRFEDLRMPCAIVATDLHTGDAVVMSGTGDVPLAIRASCALPGWYIPVIDEKGRSLIDGGLVANVPSVAVRALGADIVIAVDVNSEGAKFLGPPQTAFGVLMQAMMVIQKTAAAHDVQGADLVIRPKVGHIRWDEMARAGELIQAGEEAARLSIESIKQLLEPATETTARKWYQLKRR